MGTIEGQQPRVVLVPFPYQGHITPMLQLGSILNSRGFSITVAHTEFNSPDPLDHPEFVFLPLPDNLSGCETSYISSLKGISAMNVNSKERFHEYMVEMLEKQPQNGLVSCIVYDNLMHFVNEVATLLKLPTVVLRPNSAAYLRSLQFIIQLQADNLIPLPEHQLQDAIPTHHPLRFKDLPFPVTAEIPKILIEFFTSYANIRSSSAIILNTVDMLDHESLSKLQQHFKVPIFPIGPLQKMAPKFNTSLITEDTSSITWLDKQAPNSVLYISIGSIAIMDKKELIEMAWGLANSDQPFLWVVRPSSVSGSDWIECLPEGFEEITRERGCIVKWAPQKKVLAHPAVGGFWSHSGWNSTLESMCEGVPMICRPYFSDQVVNTRYLTHVWKVALELNSLERKGIEQAIRALMGDKEGKEMRQKALKMKQELELSIQRGGSSWNSFENLVEFIASFTQQNVKATMIPDSSD
ncbi:UDP-glucose iridoid glucosyltransferase-like [Olea europaea var. sylvestris]|uniref:UDP-glucose iridoid glucosyltransferase-like n=1 Tax=Olea europaea var. sylvestris TaxID=158386 RepID=UPI000C1CD8DC|nr:UDP-glucose iridoid glucosyltransferase-like [Olea europaea var. sylvestris]